MRPANLGTAFFNPGDPPADPVQMQRWAREMVVQLQAVIALLAAGHLDKQFKPPPKPRDGNLAYASGPGGWDPGSGKGIYAHNGTTWVLIKAL